VVGIVIRIQGLDFRYPDGEFRLRVPALEVGDGETAAVVGPSGCGKTTLLHLVAGIVTPQEGVVAVGGSEISALPDPLRRAFRIANIGLVFQEFELLEYLSVLDNILLPFRITRALDLDRAARDRAAALAERAGIGDKLRRPPDRLSHGERQRVAVCRALAPRPRLILADEPTGNLDPGNRERVLDLLFAYAAETGATLVSVTHDPATLGRYRSVVDVGPWGGAG
jgi:ABC-type lipoprotein export system ATPase subunit